LIGADAGPRLTRDFGARENRMQMAQLATTRVAQTRLEITRMGSGAWAIGGCGWEFARALARRDERPFVSTKAPLVPRPGGRVLHSEHRATAS